MSAKAKHVFVVTNWIIINIFIALWATITAFSIRTQYRFISDLSDATFNEVITQYKLALAFFIIFLFVGVEIMALSFRILSGARQRNDTILPTVSFFGPLQMMVFCQLILKKIDWHIPDVLDRTTADHRILYRNRVYCPVRETATSLKKGRSRPYFLFKCCQLDHLHRRSPHRKPI